VSDAELLGAPLFPGAVLATVWSHSQRCDDLANCGLRLDDEAVRVAVGMRLGLSLCVPHSCPCGEQVDAQGLHATVCKMAPGRIARHQVLNDIIWRSMGSAGIPTTKEPSGLARQDGKRPDGLTLIPWQGAKSLAWDVTVVSALAQSYVDRAATGVGAVAEMAAERKLANTLIWHLLLSLSLLPLRIWVPSACHLWSS